jgi:hypothetical protein
MTGLSYVYMYSRQNELGRPAGQGGTHIYIYMYIYKPSMEMLEYRYIFAGPCPERVRSLPFEFKIEQETQTTTVKLKQRLCNCLFFCWLVVLLLFLVQLFCITQKIFDFRGTADHQRWNTYRLSRAHAASPRPLARTHDTNTKPEVCEGCSQPGGLREAIK